MSLIWTILGQWPISFNCNKIPPMRHLFYAKKREEKKYAHAGENAKKAPHLAKPVGHDGSRNAIGVRRGRGETWGRTQLRDTARAIAISNMSIIWTTREQEPIWLSTQNHPGRRQFQHGLI